MRPGNRVFSIGRAAKRSTRQITAWLVASLQNLSGKYIPRADLNSDGVHDGWDLDIFQQPWGYSAGEDGRGQLSGTDLSGLSYGDAVAERKNLDNRIGFGGYMWDPWLGAYHVRHRVYDPNLRRWLQVDPIGYAGGDWDLSRYCNGDPVNFVDPSGLWLEGVAQWMSNQNAGPVGDAIAQATAATGTGLESVVTTVATMLNPAAVIEGAANTVQSGIAAENNNAARGAYSPTTFDYSMSVVAQFVGANDLAAGATSYDAATDTTIHSAEDRLFTALQGGTQMVGTAASTSAAAVNLLRSVTANTAKTAATTANNANKPSCDSGGGKAPAPTDLKRPYIRKWVRDEVARRQLRDADGTMLDPNTGQRLTGKRDLGHKPGHEFWRERERAMHEGLSQKEFNDRMNNPDYYHYEDPSSNRSHRYENP